MSRTSLTALKKQAQKPAEPAPTTKENKSNPHVSVYVPAEVIRAVKRYAFDTDQRVKDLYREAVELMLQKHKLPSIAEIVKREKV